MISHLTRMLQGFLEIIGISRFGLLYGRSTERVLSTIIGRLGTDTQKKVVSVYMNRVFSWSYSLLYSQSVHTHRAG